MTTPSGWATKDIHEVVPETARADVVKFMEGVLKTPPQAIGRAAAKALKKHEEAFRQREVHLPYFGYWIEYAYTQGTLAGFLEALKHPPVPQKTLGDILPQKCVEKLQEFALNLQNKTLIIEPGKMVVTMLRERVLEPFRDQILAEGTGITDLDFLAVTICSSIGIDPN